MCLARRTSSMRASPGPGPHATITSSRAASQHEAETGTAEAEDEPGTRKTPCPMLRRFRISTGRDARESMGLFSLFWHWHHHKKKTCRPSYESGIVGALVRGASQLWCGIRAFCRNLIVKEVQLWQSKKNSRQRSCMRDGCTAGS